MTDTIGVSGSDVITGPLSGLLADTFNSDSLVRQVQSYAGGDYWTTLDAPFDSNSNLMWGNEYSPKANYYLPELNKISPEKNKKKEKMRKPVSIQSKSDAFKYAKE